MVHPIDRGCRAVSLILILVMACGGSETNAGDDYTNILPFDTAQVRVATATDTTRLTVQLAETPAQQTMGLMERRTLADSTGMLFLYAAVQPETSAFWMFRTRIPLDIAFVDSAGIIRSIQTMQPCQSTLIEGCPSYRAGAAYRAALEVNAGFFGRRNVKVGDRVLLLDTATRRRAKRDK